MGGRIFADVQTTLGHVGNLPFSGCMDDRLKAKTTKVTNEPDNPGGDEEQGVSCEDDAQPSED